MQGVVGLSTGVFWNAMDSSFSFTRILMVLNLPNAARL